MRTPSGSAANRSGNSAMLSVPVAANTRATAIRSSVDSSTLSTT